MCSRPVSARARGGPWTAAARGLAFHVVDDRIDELRLDPRPTRPAGSSTARRSSEACIGATRTWLAPRRSASPGYVAKRPAKSARNATTTTARPFGSDAAPASGSAKRCSLGSTPRRDEFLELVDNDEQPGVRGRASRCLGKRVLRRGTRARDGALHRSLTGAHQQTPPALTAREHTSGKRGSRPARRTDDFPLPDGPAMPRKPAPTSRATSSATSRSRPKK